MRVINLLIVLVLVSCAQMKSNYSEESAEGRTFRHGILKMYKTQGTPSKVQEWESTPEAIARGKMLYSSNCMQCHGATGIGNGPLAKAQPTSPVDLVELVTEVPNFKFYLKISEWKSDMPGWDRSFSEQELSDLGEYIETLAEETISTL